MSNPLRPEGDHCPELKKPGGCQLHNLHCGYPKCNVPKAAPEGQAEPLDDAAQKRLDGLLAHARWLTQNAPPMEGLQGSWSANVRRVVNQMHDWLKLYLPEQPTSEAPMAREAWIPFLSDRADGVKGHYAIARWNPLGYREVWNLRQHCWSAFSDDVLSLEEAESLLRQITIPTPAPPPQQSAPQPLPAGWRFVRNTDGSIGIHAPPPLPGESQRTSDCVYPNQRDLHELLGKLADHQATHATKEQS